MTKYLPVHVQDRVEETHVFRQQLTRLSWVGRYKFCAITVRKRSSAMQFYADVTVMIDCALVDLADFALTQVYLELQGWATPLIFFTRGG